MRNKEDVVVLESNEMVSVFTLWLLLVLKYCEKPQERMHRGEVEAFYYCNDNQRRPASRASA